MNPEEILESISDAFYAVDKAWRFTYVNRRAEQLWRRRRETLIGKRIWDEFPNGPATEAYARLHEALDTQTPAQFETHSAFLDSWVEVNVYPSEGGLSVYFRDVTEQHRARRNAEAARQRLAFLAEASAALANSLNFQVTLEEIARTIVPTFADYTCVDLLRDGDVIERVCIRHIDPRHEQRLRETSVQAPLHLDAERGAGHVIRTGQSEIDNQFGDETIAYHIHDPVHQEVLRDMQVHSYMIAPVAARGRIFGAITFGSSAPNRYSEDDLRLAEELGRRTALSLLNAQLFAAEQQARLQAEKADELKLQLLSMVSHELRTPLASIKGFASTLLADDIILTPQMQREFLEIIDLEADKLRDLIDQLLDLSRMTAGTLSIAPEPHAFTDVLRIASAQLAALCTAHELVIDVPPDLPPVLVDTQRIAQVLGNLVSNAAKYTPPGTTITIQAYVEDTMLRVDVHDQGDGIPEAARQYIFEAFRQLENSHARKGAGLGLAICKGLIERHGGRIWIESGSERGTTVSFTLRLAAETSSPGPFSTTNNMP